MKRMNIISVDFKEERLKATSDQSEESIAMTCDCNGKEIGVVNVRMSAEMVEPKSGKHLKASAFQG